MQDSAEAVEKKLSEALTVCKAEVAEYKAIWIDLRNSECDEKYDEKDCDLDRKELDEILELKFRLLALARMTEKAEKSRKELSPSVTVDTDKLVKIKKISPSKFYGKYQDFLSFKSNFNAIVAVEGQGDVEIGAALNESFPKKYEHLIDNLQVNDHKEIMRKLTRKFGDLRDL